MPDGDPAATTASPMPADASSPVPGTRRGPWWKDPILLVALVLWVGTLGMLRKFDHAHTLPTLHVVATDRVATPGGTIEISAHVERHRADGSHDHAGVEVDLRLASEAPASGVVKTDGNGIARRTVTVPSEPGPVMIAVDAVGEYAAGDGIRFDPVVTVVAPGVPWILCEVDTVVPGVVPGVGRTDDDEDPIGPASRAATLALQELSSGREIVYLHLDGGRDGDLLRRALRLGGAPMGAVIAERGPEEGVDAYRARIVEAMASEIGAPALVVTRSPNGCFVYREADLPTIVLENTPCEGAQHADSWNTARKLIAERVPTP